MSAGYVGIVVIHLHFPQAGSLKAKRAELNAVKARLHGRHGLTVAEVDHQDTWQRATLAGALTGGRAGQVEDALDRVERWLDARFPSGVWVQRTLRSLEDLSLPETGLMARRLA
jgi:uncharacterized protein YlxP (DUF503 family)